MAITDRAQVRPGVTLVGKLKGVEYACKVREEKDGTTAFVLDKRQVPEGTVLTHKTPSGAAQAVMGGIAANGWRFWSIKGGEQDSGEFAKANPQPKAAQKAEADPAPKAPRKARKRAPHKIIKPATSQADVPEGAVRFMCDGCMDAFVAVPVDGETPACPKGHRNDDPEFAALNEGSEAAVA